MLDLKKYSGDFEEDPPTQIHSTSGTNRSNTDELTRKVTVFRVKTGLESGKLFILQPGEWIAGRSNSSDIVLRDTNCSRQHAKIIVSGQGRCFVSDLDSTNGVFKNGTKITAVTELQSGDELMFSDQYSFQVERLINEEALKQSDLYVQATQDALTGAFNRKFFERCFKSLTREAAPSIGSALIIFDADHFKKVNDTWGHAGGDAVLRSIAERARASLRAEDIFSRIGGEEFIVLARVDSPQTVQMLAERLRMAMNSMPVDFEGNKISFSISLGSVFFKPRPSLEFESLYKIADGALYQSKQSGRNRATHSTI